MTPPTENYEFHPVLWRNPASHLLHDIVRSERCNSFCLLFATCKHLLSVNICLLTIIPCYCTEWIFCCFCVFYPILIFVLFFSFIGDDVVMRSDDVNFWTVLYPPRVILILTFWTYNSKKFVFITFHQINFIEYSINNVCCIKVSLIRPGRDGGWIGPDYLL